MKSTAATVDEYLAEVPEDRRSALQTLRSLCLAELPGYVLAGTASKNAPKTSVFEST